MTLSRRPGSLTWAKSGSADFDALFLDHWERLCRLLFHILGDWDEAQDLALETFERLYRRPPQDSANLSAWLYRVATNLGFNALRARKRRLQYETEAGATAEALAREGEAGMDPSAAAEQRLERQRVRRVLSAMKPRSAELLILRHSGLSYAEVAAALEIAPASVGTLLARATAEFEKLYLQEPQVADELGQEEAPDAP
jgi:RNA polymerase sigma-70 factor (ECF subfamily)